MTQTLDTAIPQAVSQLNDTIVQAGEHRRALMTEMTQFTKDEFSRFLNLRLERNGEAMEKLQHCTGLPGLFAVQQEWVRDLINDYSAQNVRLAGAVRGVTQSVVASASEAASENLDRVREHASDAMHQAGEQFNTMNETAENAAEYVETQTQH